MADRTDSERTVVKTYVPAYQKERWAEDADELDMTQSEFVRSMVQAGRAKFEPVEPDETDATPGVGSLETRIEGILSEEDACSWDELVAALTEDIEDDVDDALESLQSENLVKHSGRQGGYALVDDGN